LTSLQPIPIDTVHNISMQYDIGNVNDCCVINASSVVIILWFTYVCPETDIVTYASNKHGDIYLKQTWW